MRKKHFFFTCFLCLFILSNIDLQAQVNLNKGLLYWLPINGNANDASGNGLNGTVNSGTLIPDRFGVPNSAYSFNGALGISIASVSNSGYSAGTISFWLKTTSTTADVRLYVGPPGLIYMGLATTGHFIGIFDNTSSGKTSANESVSAVNTGNWVNLTTKNDGSTTYIYVNGKLETYYASTYASSNLTSVSVPDYNSYYSAGLYGDMDDIRAYTRSLSDSEVMAIYEMPHADFGTKNQCIDDSVHFTDSSIVTSGSKYLWKFGDNATSTKQNPSHLYSKAGTYNVTLIMTSPYKSVDSITKSVTVTPLPIAHFKETINAYKNQVSFTPFDTTDSQYAWDFGDGNTTNQQKPVHVYNSYGSHTITLTVTNANGCDSTYSTPITVYAPPIAAIGIENTCALSNTLFLDSSSEPDPSTYIWNFGDNTGSTLKNPVHVYADSGTYKISFKVTTSHGLSDSLTKSITVHSLPNASFKYSISNYDVMFTPSKNNIASYTWDFGDSSQSQAKNPHHTYNSFGTYTVSLTTQNANGCDSTFNSIIVLEQIPVASFKTSNMCFGDTMHFSFSGIASAGSVYSWNFGDNGSSNQQNPGHLYAAPGDYIVSLKVTNSQGSSDSGTWYAIVLPLPVSGFNYSASASTLMFSPSDSSAISYNWDFGDQNSSGAQNPVHTYTGSGSFLVSLTVKNQNGCSSTTKKTIVVNDVPNALFTVANTCEGDTVVFMDLSTAPPSSIYSWNFGDGSSSNFINPTHVYTGAGNFKVGLKVTNPDGISDTISKTITIFGAPSAMFKTVINKFKVSFIPADSTLKGYSWDFGDSNGSSSPKAVHTYGYTGKFNVTLTTKNINSCESTTSSPITIDGNTGIQENPAEDNSGIYIYPNPVVNGKLHIGFNAIEPNCHLEIINIEGQTLFSEELTATKTRSEKDIDISAYPAGVYCIMLTGNQKILSGKIVVR